MASPGVVSSTVTASPPSSTGSEPTTTPLVSAVEIRKRKRKESNRLSAQRSRARKHRQLDELTAEVAALRARNGAMGAAARDAVRRCAAVQAENALLQARALELGARLQSLTDLIQCMQVQEAAVMYNHLQPPLLDATMFNYY